MHDTPDLSFDPCFLDAPDELFQHLVASVEWDTRMRARRTASFGVAYNYSQIDYPATSLPDALQALCERLHRRLGFLPNNCLLNLYEDGQSSMGFHSDDCSELAADTGVAILSLGSARPIHFRSKADRQREVTWELSPGSLLYMDQAVQAHWLHAIPRVASAGPRISLTFRRILR
ncbi:alkylated DNA repair protein [Pseudomonas tohonis]|uniref:Alkylated DNA repair protein n=1 Tax=Pseudomonas tohonis TaxID=2725477 RepID=A0A6J4E476_9PSED|nr:alpha-ketoglutarate-dependent dioxygenase AlkB [Pseudomonas tohonis]BCG24410.1 alkylated DNA repair protein [Pseudomonas tohonis]GJN52232.1 alkylated DNA repair protein [Pseudomonas tohonis]